MPPPRNPVSLTNARDYVSITSSASAVTLGGANGTGQGAKGDYVSHITVFPTSTSPGTLSIADGSASAITIFAGGASSLSNQAPFPIPLGAESLNGAWKVTIGSAAGMTVLAFGNFT